MCVLIRPNTLLLCIFLFCIFLLYPTDSHVEVQIRILLKNKYKKSCQKCEHLQSHFDFLKNSYPVSLLLSNNSRAKITFCYCVSLSCFVWIYNHTVTIVTQKYKEVCLISKTILIGFFILEKKLTTILLFLFLINTLLLYIPLLALTHGQTDRRRLKYTCFAWAGVTFFISSCAVVSVLCSGGK
jgi:hypothetical protein